tara:strand:- start:434 stop:1615 length:1182 start_codon:yes stop_codon:yes gene_type:complete
MSRILKRPMFKRGGQSNDGIMSNVVDRKQYALGSIDEEKLRSDAAAITGVLDRFAPIPKTRLPLGEVGFLLASGADPIDALGAGYSKFVKADDATQAARAKRAGAAVSTALSSQLKKSKDTRTDLEKKLEAAGFIKGSPEYEAAMKTLIFKDVAPKAGFRTLTQEEISKIPGLDKDKAYQVNLDPTSDNYQKIFTIGGASTNINMNLEKFEGQQRGVVQSGSERDKIIQETSFVARQLGNLDNIDKLLTDDPTLAGLAGFARRTANQVITAAKDFNFDLTGPIKALGAEGLVLDTDIAKLNAIEDLLVPAYARVLNPNTRITNLMLQEAKAAIGLTGITGSDEVRARLSEIKEQFKTYINDQNALLGKQIIDQNIIKKFKIEVVDGKPRLVEQ